MSLQLVLFMEIASVVVSVTVNYGRFKFESGGIYRVLMLRSFC